MVTYIARPRTALMVLLTVNGLAGCSEYLDRKNTIAFNAGEAVQTNITTHVIDPWPAHARNRNIAFNGQRMQSAVERYRCRSPGNGSSGGENGGTASGDVNGGAAPQQAQEGQGSC